MIALCRCHCTTALATLLSSAILKITHHRTEGRVARQLINHLQPNLVCVYVCVRVCACVCGSLYAWIRIKITKEMAFSQGV